MYWKLTLGWTRWTAIFWCCMYLESRLTCTTTRSNVLMVMLPHVWEGSYSEFPILESFSKLNVYISKAYIRVVNKRQVWVAVISFEVDGPFKSIFRNENLQGILPNKEDICIFVLDSMTKEQVRVQSHRRTLCILGHFVSVIQIITDLLNAFSIQQFGICHICTDRYSQKSMDQQVGISKETNLFKFAL